LEFIEGGPFRAAFFIWSIAMAQVEAGLQAKAAETRIDVARMKMQRGLGMAAAAKAENTPPRQDSAASMAEPAMAAALHAVASAVSHANKPKRLVRDADGRALGVEPVE
jgi:hypothetical protein